MDRLSFLLLTICWISLELNHFTYQLIVEKQHQQQQQQQEQNEHISNDNKDYNIPLIRRDDGSFSSCLLIMDENYRLAEWLSYHYYTYNLRYVIVGVDDRSQTSPAPIFDEFRNRLNMTILEWSDAVYLNGTKHEAPLGPGAPPGRVRKRYIYRQLFFLGKCISHLHRVGQTWTALWDPDEYLVFRRESTILRGLTERDLSVSQQNVFYNFVQQRISGKDNNNNNNNISCITIPRVLMGAQKEERPSALEQRAAGSIIQDPQRLTTFRWHYHAHEKASDVNGLTKTMMDASQIHPPITIRNPHRPLLDRCGSPHFRDNENAFFRINHYLGSWQEYSYRNDARKGKERSQEAWAYRAKACGQRDRSRINEWLVDGFGSRFPMVASSLLSTAGLPRNNNNSSIQSNESEWKVDRTSKIFNKTGSAQFKKFVGAIR